jgi:hypothetical protein
LIAGRQDDPATINKESTSENNTDVDRWVDARRLRINSQKFSRRRTDCRREREELLAELKRRNVFEGNAIRRSSAT